MQALGVVEAGECPKGGGKAAAEVATVRGNSNDPTDGSRKDQTIRPKVEKKLETTESTEITEARTRRTKEMVVIELDELNRITERIILREAQLVSYLKLSGCPI
jgi:hypothetical protein